MSKSAFRPWLIALSVLAALFICVVGVWFYVTQRQVLREDAEANLAAIAELKVRQITAWRADQLGFSAESISNPFTRAALLQWLADPQAVGREAIVALFQGWREHHNFYDVVLIDAAGQSRLSLRDDADVFGHDAAGALVVAFRERRPVLTDLHRGPGALPPHLDVFAPLFARDGRPAGALLLRSDARQFLYPLIQSWPVPSQSAETLLVRREGDRVLFLHRIVPGAASSSYGIEVARLAGLPQEVLERASSLLARLERREFAPVRPTRRASEPPQLELFGAPQDPLRARLTSLVVDQVTPLQALHLLYELKRLARES